ncbi:MAG: hypothetical protein RLY20_1579 [Verrucomicrobiota bacterium]
MSAKKILIVDDSVVVTKTTAMVLTKAGYEVSTAADGSTAIGAVRRERPDLILLDIGFPIEMGVTWDGILIMQWLKRMEETRNIPVIVISGQDPEKYRAQVLSLGAVAYLAKPVNNEELIKLISEALASTATT